MILEGKNLVGWPVHTCAISRATIVWVNKTSRIQNLHLIRRLNDFFGTNFFSPQCKLCFIQKKFTFFQNSKEFFKKHWGGPREEGVEGIYKKVPFVIQVLMRMDKIQTSGEWSLEGSEVQKSCKQALCNFKTHFKTLFWKHFVQQQPVQNHLSNKSISISKGA